MRSQRFAFLSAAALLAALSLLTPLPAQEPGAKDKKAAPTPAAHAQAEAVISKLYADRFKAAPTDRAAAQALAAELLAQGTATRDDDALQFAALKLAADLAARGNGGTALEAVKQLDVAFRVDALALKADVYVQLETGTVAKEDAVLLAEAVLYATEAALDADHFAAADKLMATATKAAQKSQAPALAARVEKRGAEVAGARKAFAALKPLLAKADAGDEKAILEVGKYFCFVKGNFDRGLPLLAKSNDAALKALAQRDLARPKEARQQAELAEDWYGRGEAEKGLAQRQAFRRALFWYRAALPNLEGLSKLRAARLVDELARQFPTGTPPPLAVEVTTELRAINPAHGGMVTAITVSADGKLVLSGGIEGTLRLWDAATGEKKRDLGGNGVLTGVALSPDNRLALSGGTDNSMRLWDLETGKEVRRFGGHPNAVRVVHFLPNGKQVISACDDGAIRIFDRDSGNLIKSIPAHTSYFTGLAISADGRRAVSSSADRSVKVWDLEKGAEVHKMMHADVVQHVALTADGKRAVTCGYDATVRVWDVDEGKELRRLGHPCMVWAVAVSPDGRHVYTACGGGAPMGGASIPASDKYNQVRVFDLHTGKELRVLGGHTQHVTVVAVSGDGRLLASGSQDNTVRLWGAK